MTFGTLQAFLYFTGLFLAGILLGHVQRTKMIGKRYCRNNVWGWEGKTLSESQGFKEFPISLSTTDSSASAYCCL